MTGSDNCIEEFEPPSWTNILVAVEKSSWVARHRGTDLWLAPDGLLANGKIYPDLTTENCTLYPCPTLSDPWVNGAYKIVGGVLHPVDS